MATEKSKPKSRMDSGWVSPLALPRSVEKTGCIGRELS